MCRRPPAAVLKHVVLLTPLAIDRARSAESVDLPSTAWGAECRLLNTDY